MTNIDVTMTATLRPKILERTLESFFDNMLGGWENYLRIIINVDPVGSEENLYPQIHNLCLRFFKKVKINRSNVGSFPKAFNTVWSLSTAPIVFHLEEDWELQSKVNLREMLSIMRRFPDLAHLRLSAMHSYPDHIKCWQRHFFMWNGFFYECKRDEIGMVGWCGHPSLNRLEFVKEALPRMNPHLNPEKQLKGRVMGDLLERWRFGIYHHPPEEGHKNRPPLIKDIGRAWISESGWRKAGGNAQHFTHWEKI